MNMSVFDLSENCGRIVKGVNTTCDVGTNQIKIEGKKFMNNMSDDGVPPSVDYTDIGKSLLFSNLNKI